MGFKDMMLVLGGAALGLIALWAIITFWVRPIGFVLF